MNLITNSSWILGFIAPLVVSGIARASDDTSCLEAARAHYEECLAWVDAGGEPDISCEEQLDEESAACDSDVVTTHTPCEDAAFAAYAECEDSADDDYELAVCTRVLDDSLAECATVDTGVCEDQRVVCTTRVERNFERCSAHGVWAPSGRSCDEQYVLGAERCDLRYERCTGGDLYVGHDGTGDEPIAIDGDGRGDLPTSIDGGGAPAASTTVEWLLSWLD